MSLTGAKGDPADAAANTLKAGSNKLDPVTVPEVDTSDDTPIRWEDTVGCQIAAENTAERNGTSYQAAWDAIRRGCDDRGEQNTPRSGEQYTDGGEENEGG